MSALGPRFNEVIQEEISDWIETVGREYYVDRYGEVDRARYEEFCSKRDQLEKEGWSRLLRYEKHATRFRLRNGMRPFHWSLETVDRVCQHLANPKSKLPVFRELED